jgi:hypothetical protein
LVPGIGSGHAWVKVSPGATRTRTGFASFSMSPAASARKISTSNTPSGAPEIVTRGATAVRTTSVPRWDTTSPVTAWG